MSTVKALQGRTGRFWEETHIRPSPGQRAPSAHVLHENESPPAAVPFREARVAARLLFVSFERVPAVEPPKATRKWPAEHTQSSSAVDAALETALAGQSLQTASSGPR